MTVQDTESRAHRGRRAPKAADGRTPVLRGKGLIKTFGRVIGLDGVDIELYPGEVLAVIGDNGAGKSTLIKCLSGPTPSTAAMLLDGHQVTFKRPQDARDAGIETVYQTLAVIPALDIASNLYLAREERRAGPAGLGAADARQEGHARPGQRRRPGPRHPDDPEHGSGGRDAVRWPAPGGRRRESGGVREQGRHPRRADGCSSVSRKATPSST